MSNYQNATAAMPDKLNSSTHFRRSAAGLFSICCLAALALQMQPALAQDAVDDTDDSEGMALEEALVLEPVIVTARRIEEVANTVPLTIRVISEDQIILQGVKDLDDVARLTPGLTFDLVVFLTTRGRQFEVCSPNAAGPAWR